MNARPAFAWNRRLTLIGAGLLGCASAIMPANALDLAQSPLSLKAAPPPLILLTLGRDHKLYHEAYDDYSDLDGDGRIDTGYIADPKFKYAGYFDSEKCYGYANGVFTPAKMATDKKCQGQWSGDFLNYVTTSRLDAIRKVLYGGKRSTDNKDTTILERAHVPQDAHVWGKEYDPNRDSYDITRYTPLSRPALGTRHLFANVSLTKDGEQGSPLMHVLPNSQYRIWDWVSIQAPVAGDRCLRGYAGDGNEGPLCTDKGNKNWAIVPASRTHGLSDLKMTTYRVAPGDEYDGWSNMPYDNGSFKAHEAKTVKDGSLCGTVSASNIDGKGNPLAWPAGGPPLDAKFPNGKTPSYCTQEEFFAIFEGKIKVERTGTYRFGLEADDVAQLLIDDKSVVVLVNRPCSPIWPYPCLNQGAGRSEKTLLTHFKKGSEPESGDVFLEAGKEYKIKYRYRNASGDQAYRLYWKLQDSSTEITDYVVRVRVCEAVDTSAEYEGRENNCRDYGTDPNVVYKPTGLLHQYGQEHGMRFGLITGSYDQNFDGGILRKAFGPITDEIDTATGIFKEAGTTCGPDGKSPCTKGIIGSIDSLRTRIKAFTGNFSLLNYDNSNSCYFLTKPEDLVNSKCEMWGNPLAEMMFEGLRYFSGATQATPAFGASKTKDEAIGLPRAAWSDPYAQIPRCTQPYFMLMSDVYPSFDADSLPGSDFSTVSATKINNVPLDFKTLGGALWNSEFNGTRSVFIGQVKGLVGDGDDKAPTVKQGVKSFSSIRGLVPSDPSRQGSYYSSLLAHFAHINDINPAKDRQSATTYAIALSSPIPRIVIPVGTDKKMTFVPFAKSVGRTTTGSLYSEIGTGKNQWTPTVQIADFYVDTISNTNGENDKTINGGRPYYKFRVNFEDGEQGGDYDMDVMVVYEIWVDENGEVLVAVTSEQAEGGLVLHAGYVVSGTEGKDGARLVVRDWDTKRDEDKDISYHLDKPGLPRGSKESMPLYDIQRFKLKPKGWVQQQTDDVLLENPLWYAAKFGAFKDSNGNKLPDLASEWDADGDGVPDTYFPVTSPHKLYSQIDKALASIARNASGSVAPAAASSTSIQTDAHVFIAGLNSDGWKGDLDAYKVTESGISGPIWRAHEKLAGLSGENRTILTFDPKKSGGTGIPFRWSAMADNGALRGALNKQVNGTTDTLGERRLRNLRGLNATGMRITADNKLGDIVNSAPAYVGPPKLGHQDASYKSFAEDKANRTPMVYVGANDGMLHGFRADTGEEKLAYVPSELYRARRGEQPLSKLTQPGYGSPGNQHQYYVDGSPAMGDICTGNCTAKTDWKTILVGGLNAGGQGVYALDITDPGAFGESKPGVVKWEFLDDDFSGDSSSPSGDADLGYTFGRPAIVRLCTAARASVSIPCTQSKWYVVFGNGYDSTEADDHRGSGHAALFVLDADTGRRVGKITLPDGAGLGDPNGLSEVTPRDVDGDGVVDYVYAGDLKGNVWRIDFASKDGQLALNGTGLLYTARNGDNQVQPITTAPEVVAHPQGGVLVIFGTGRYIYTGDQSLTQTQTLYGIWDKQDGSTSAATGGRDKLLAQTVGNAVSEAGQKYFESSSKTVDWSTQIGWYLDLAQSERIIYNPRAIRRRLLQVVGTSPSSSSDPCELSSGTTRFFYLNPVTGARPEWNIFDGMSKENTYVNILELAGIFSPGAIISIGNGKAFSISGAPLGSTSGSHPPFNLNTTKTRRISWKQLLDD